MRRKPNNRGFSLVELLVGITILAVVVIPLIHAFVTSAATSEKAKRLRSETVAAQNIIESYRTTTIGEVLDRLSKGVDPLGGIADIRSVGRLVVGEGGAKSYEEIPDYGAADTNGPGYRLLLDNVRADSKTYDAALYLDATGFGQNNEKIVSYKAMDAVYIEPNPDDEDPARQANSPDFIASQTFASMATIDSGYGVEDTYFLDRMSRHITINIRKVGENEDVISCSAQFDYETDYTFSYPLLDGSGNPILDEFGNPMMGPETGLHYATTVTNDFFSGGYSSDSVYGLYFFFYPNDPSNDDRIEVLNGDNIPISVVLIRQSDAFYDPVIILREKSYDFFRPPYATLHYNDKFIGYRYYYAWDNYFFKTIIFDGVLVDTEARNRLYGVTVALYKDGADPDTDAPLAVFDASSLE